MTCNRALNLVPCASTNDHSTAPVAEMPEAHVKLVQTSRSLATAYILHPGVEHCPGSRSIYINQAVLEQH